MQQACNFALGKDNPVSLKVTNLRVSVPANFLCEVVFLKIFVRCKFEILTKKCLIICLLFTNARTKVDAYKQLSKWSIIYFALGPVKICKTFFKQKYKEFLRSIWRIRNCCSNFELSLTLTSVPVLWRIFVNAGPACYLYESLNCFFFFLIFSWYNVQIYSRQFTWNLV